MFPKAPVRLEGKIRGSDRITIRKIFDAKRGGKFLVPINCMKRIFRNLAVINTRADTQGTR